ncbi:MAG: hypothetical protein EBS89_10675 [Proteobacteria bacterium]|nr:hypothetical protein [Pseudomonadota bacterium]
MARARRAVAHATVAWAPSGVVTGRFLSGVGMMVRMATPSRRPVYSPRALGPYGGGTATDRLADVATLVTST